MNLTGGPGRRGRGPWTGPLPVLGGLLALYLIVPIVALLPRLGQARFGAPGLGSALAVSAVTATISSALIAVGGIPLAYLLSRARGRVAQVLGVAVQLPLALPPLMSGILLVEVVGPYTFLGRAFHGSLTDSLVGIVLAQTFVAAPFLIVSARSAFATVDPALLDVAATLGHRHRARFARVSLPLAAPGIRAGLLLSWLRAFGEFGATVILAYHPYSLPVFTFVQFTGTGLRATLAPTAAALGAAGAVLVLANWYPTRALARLVPARLVPARLVPARL
ncbi:MAG: molybdate ABC transporter permease subunit, partial [Acidimicrobiales bacterium]